MTVSDRREHADVDGAFVEFEHLRPVVERVFVFFKVVVQMPESDKRIRVVFFHVEHFQIQLFRFFKIVYFSVCVGNARENRDIAVVVYEVLFPNVDRFAVLIERFIAVGEPEQRIVVSRMVGKAVVVIAYRFVIVILLALRIAESYEGVVVVVFDVENFFKHIFRIGDSITF